MAGTKRQKVTIGERAKGVVQAKNVSRKEAKEAKLAKKKAHPGFRGLKLFHAKKQRKQSSQRKCFV